MARTVTLGGSSYSIPEPGDNGYDQTALTNYLVALATAFPQLVGGLYTLAAELDLGASFGVKMLYAKSETANPAGGGMVRLAKTDSVKWRNNANASDLALAIDTGDALTFNGANVTGNPLLDVGCGAGQTVATGATPIVVFNTVTTDSDSGYNVGTGRYTIPTGKGGDYQISAAIDMTNTQAGSANAGIYKAGSIVKFLGSITAQAANSILSGSATIRLAAGDIIDIRVTNAGAGNLTIAASATASWFTLKRIPT